MRLYFEKLIPDHWEEYVGAGVRRLGGTVRRPLQFTYEKYWQLMGESVGWELEKWKERRGLIVA